MRYFLLFPILLLTACIGTDLVDDPMIAERLTIMPRIDAIQVGETVQFEVEYLNGFGNAEEVPIVWSSTDPEVVRISENGLAEGLAEGPAKIIADAGTVADTLILNTEGVTNTSETDELSGMFEPVSGSYDIEGTARLTKASDTKLQLIFESNFRVSAGPSLYVLLANHTNGAYTVTRGSQEVNGTSAQITPERMTSFSGEMIFDVPDGVEIDDYDYVVLYCTLGPVFGFAELE